MIDYYTLPLRDQVFTQVMPNGANVVYAATRIREHCMRTRARVHLVALQLDHVMLIKHQRGLEKDRLLQAIMTTHHSPLLYLHQEDGTHFLADGSHTYVARYLRGQRYSLAYIVPREVWQDFIVTGSPTETMSEHELLTSHSHVTRR
jgi:hypothetical protein